MAPILIGAGAAQETLAEAKRKRTEIKLITQTKLGHLFISILLSPVLKIFIESTKDDQSF
jgi:hypothetical protein